MEEITLDEFIIEARKRLEKFKRWYNESRKEDPTYFPAKMLRGDWDEQEAMFDEDEGVEGPE